MLSASRHLASSNRLNQSARRFRCKAASPDTSSSLSASWATLRDFTIQRFKGTADKYTVSREKREELRDMLLRVYAEPFPEAGWSGGGNGSSTVLIGLMASDVKMGMRALRDYCEALDVEFILPEVKVAGASSLSQVQGSIYIKHNPAIRVCYVSPFTGQDRGVLLQMGQMQLGHFPLGLFDEDLKKPAPALH
jgi:hypothetical protein